MGLQPQARLTEARPYLCKGAACDSRPLRAVGSWQASSSLPRRTSADMNHIKSFSAVVPAAPSFPNTVIPPLCSRTRADFRVNSRGQRRLLLKDNKYCSS